MVGGSHPLHCFVVIIISSCTGGQQERGSEGGEAQTNLPQWTSGWYYYVWGFDDRRDRPYGWFDVVLIVLIM